MSKNAFKIAIYSGEIPSTVFIERLIEGLSSKGYRVYLFGAIKKASKYPRSVKVIGYKPNRFFKLYHLIVYSLLLTVFKNNTKRQLDSLLKAQHKDNLNTKLKFYPVLWHQPDMFHLQWAKGIEEWLWIRDFGMKLILSLRGAHINYSPIVEPRLAALYRRCFPEVDGFHAVSKAIGKESELYGAEPSKVHTVYSGMDLKSMSLVFKTRETRTLNIISVGRPHWVKGYNYAIDACKILKEKGMSFKYSIVGASTDLELVYQIKDLGLTNEVRLTPTLPFFEVQELIQSSDVLMLSSVKEGIANVVLEAMALGTLVLSTDCGGMDEVIEDGINGFLVPVRDSKALAERLLSISSLTPNQKALLLANARATIETQHQASQMVSGMEALYQSVLTPYAL